MSNSIQSVVSGRYARSLARNPSVRPYLSSRVAVASDEILAAGLVAAPPDVDGVRTEVRPLQLVALALPSTAPAAVLDKYLRDQGQTVLPDIPVFVTGDGVVKAVRSTGSPKQVIDSTAQLPGDPAIEGQQVTNAALTVTPNVITDPILRTIVIAFAFFVVFPAFWVVIMATSAINVVLDALGLALLSNVPDPRFGPTTEMTAAAVPTVTADPLLSETVAPQTHNRTSATGVARTGPMSSGSVAPNTHKTALSTSTVEADPPASDPVAPDPLGNLARVSREVAPVSKPKRVCEPCDGRYGGQMTAEHDSTARIEELPGSRRATARWRASSVSWRPAARRGPDRSCALPTCRRRARSHPSPGSAFGSSRVDTSRMLFGPAAGCVA